MPSPIFFDIVKHRGRPSSCSRRCRTFQRPRYRRVQPLADLLLRDPEFVSQRSLGVARPVEGQSLDVQSMGYCTNHSLNR